MSRYLGPVFLGAFLLFQVQPLIARYILPWFGGTPAVWTTCMLFFQMLLLLGYLYAHLVISRLRPRAQASVNAGLLIASLALMGYLKLAWGVPIIPTSVWKPPDGDFPVPRILFLLTISVGLPYLVVSTTSPLLQAWFSRTNPGVSPYRMYTLSNIGSLLALVTYPFLVEPAMALRAQATMWSCGYVVFTLGYLACAAGVWRACGGAAAAKADGDEPAPEACELELAPRPSRLHQSLWLALPALASVLLLATTNHLCQEVAVIPFLWIVPLSLYLLSFIICFDNERWYVRRLFLPLMMVLVPLACYLLVGSEDRSLKLQILAYAGALFVCCMVCHGELVALKPHPRYLTGFYLMISVGGAIGGLFVGVLAPYVFRGFWELQIGLVLAWILGLGVLIGYDSVWPLWGRRVALFFVGATLCLPLVLLSTQKASSNMVTVTRNFYGLLKVRDESVSDPDWHCHTLVHGRIIHGFQYLAADKRRMACSYYGEESGVGLAALNHPRRLAGKPMRIGVIGLGTGSMAVYGERGDTVRFYDINPAVLKIARDPKCFTYLNDCPAKVDVVLGDARISLERELKQEGPQQYDILVVDAFSSDAIPAHLLTKESVELYLAHLRRPSGVLAVHVSNRSLDLKPVVWKLADYLKLESGLIEDAGDGSTTYKSDWMLLTSDRDFLRNPDIFAARSRRGVVKPTRMWTDDYQSLYPILK